ncbi:MAG: PD40 domain-containing protein, partial [Anaerolineae bacterium]|nr:PD40 domain-containing protein [Anaerolineae bacterium]
MTCILLPQHQAVQAQASPDPILLNIQGDLWAWTSADQPLQQLTDWGANEAPILSPDGRRAAYLSTSSLFVDWARTATRD